jgi:hypothetical protein
VTKRCAPTTVLERADHDMSASFPDELEAGGGLGGDERAVIVIAGTPKRCGIEARQDMRLPGRNQHFRACEPHGSRWLSDFQFQY